MKTLKANKTNSKSVKEAVKQYIVEFIRIVNLS